MGVGRALRFTYIRGCLLYCANDKLRILTKALSVALPAFLAAIIFTALAVTTAGLQSNFAAYVIRINSNIDQGTADLVERELELARDTGADAVVIQLNTNGGLLGSTEAIVDAMAQAEKADVKIVVYVGPAGGRAFSAGAFISMASDYIAMDDGTVIGSSTPILGTVDPSERTKITNGLASWMQSLAELHGRNQTLARSFVTEGISVTAEEAIRYGIADAKAASPEEALSRVGVASSPLGYVDSDLRSAMLSFLSDPVVVSLLMSVGTLLILVDLFHPTIIATALGVTLMGMSLYGLEILGLQPLVAILLLAGSATILLELKKGHGLLAFTGVALTLIGAAIMISREPLLPKAPEALVPTYVLGAAALVGAAIFGFYMHQIRAALSRKPAAHDLRLLIGMEGLTKTDVGPGKDGVVLIASDLWNASADETVAAGEKVIVTEVKGLKLRVKRP